MPQALEVNPQPSRYRFTSLRVPTGVAKTSTPEWTGTAARPNAQLSDHAFSPQDTIDSGGGRRKTNRVGLPPGGRTVGLRPDKATPRAKRHCGDQVRGRVQHPRRLNLIRVFVAPDIKMRPGALFQGGPQEADSPRKTRVDKQRWKQAHSPARTSDPPPPNFLTPHVFARVGSPHA